MPAPSGREAGLPADGAAKHGLAERRQAHGSRTPNGCRGKKGVRLCILYSGRERAATDYARGEKAWEADAGSAVAHRTATVPDWAVLSLRSWSR